MRETPITDDEMRVRIIAQHMAMLPDGHPAKVTRNMVAIIRKAGERIGREGNPYLGFPQNLAAYADGLARYLPPE